MNYRNSKKFYLNPIYILYAVLLVTLFILYSQNSQAISREEKILNRIKPIGSLNLADGAELTTSAKPALGKDAGVKRYKQSCYICHDTGASGAPKLGDKSAWNPRLKQGTKTLYDHSVNGYNAMPAKGGCINCSDKEIELTVDYMLNKVQ